MQIAALLIKLQSYVNLRMEYIIYNSMKVFTLIIYVKTMGETQTHSTLTLRKTDVKASLIMLQSISILN